jgi:hypothetical protein
VSEIDHLLKRTVNMVMPGFEDFITAVILFSVEDEGLDLGPVYDALRL